MSTPTELAFSQVVKSYGGFTLGPIDTVFSTGVTALLGANGAGKTTLIQLAVGVLAPDSGRVVTASEQRRHRVAAEVGYLPQDFTGPKGVRVGEYLTFIAWARSTRARRLTKEDVHHALERVQLTGKVNAKIGQLSGGMVRRLGIAQALLGQAGMLFLDEPTVGLDPVQRRDLRALLTDLGAEATVVVSTHLSEDVAAVADTVHVLSAGRSVFDGSTAALCALAGSDTVTGDAVEAGFMAAIAERAVDVAG